MTTDAEGVVREFFDRVWNAGDHAAADALFDAATFRHHDLVTGSESGLSGFVESIRTLRGLFSPLEFRVHEAVADAGRVASRWEAIGEHAATGRAIRVDGMSFDHVTDGRIVEDWTVWDRGGLDRQLPDGFGI